MGGGITNNQSKRLYRSNQGSGMENPRCKLYGMLCDPQYIKMHDISRRVYDPDGIAPTIHCMGGGGNLEPKIICGSKQKKMGCLSANQQNKVT